MEGGSVLKTSVWAYPAVSGRWGLAFVVNPKTCFPALFRSLSLPFPPFPTLNSLGPPLTSAGLPLAFATLLCGVARRRSGVVREVA